MFKDLVRQFNIIMALAIHDLQGQMKNYNYGFAWMLLEPLIYIVGFRVMRKFLGGLANPPGMTPLMFYVTAVFTIYVFSQGMAGGRSAARPSSMLLFPRVSQLDVALSKAISHGAIELTLFMIIAPPIALYEGAYPPQNIGMVLFALAMAWVIGLGVGFTLSAAMRVFPPTIQFAGYAMFGIRMASGMFFCVLQLPPALWPYLAWNPLLHCTEMARDGWFAGYTSPIASPMYTLDCALGFLLLGLSVERFMRRVPYV